MLQLFAALRFVLILIDQVGVLPIRPVRFKQFFVFDMILRQVLEDAL